METIRKISTVDPVDTTAPRSRNLSDGLISSGRLIRIVRPSSENIEPLEDPELCLLQLRKNCGRADLFTFSQPFSQLQPRHNYHYELEPVALLEIESYTKWWKETVNDKTRNMVRKASKKGVQIEIVSYSDDFVRGIKEIYDECPVRQGKKSRHYGKSFQQIKREHGTFLNRSEFVAARYEDRLIGFAKVVFQKDFASVMNLIALLSERNRAPTNALLAKVVERCAEKGVGILHYGVWSRRGFGDFKVHHGFECRQLPRYYVPLTGWGSLALRLGLHRPIASRIPESCLDWLATLRTRYYAWRYPMN